uniref:Reverse transcriptase Ty1/copia-type domain-containing protein n=1 Tax=Lactuca sativa TaxID=4236 RepID=A0A9R1WJU4_LACSA|nr:hypothetical protein LSAT_V11C100003830 [Lactuca sativa]
MDIRYCETFEQEICRFGLGELNEEFVDENFQGDTALEDSDSDKDEYEYVKRIKERMNSKLNEAITKFLEPIEESLPLRRSSRVKMSPEFHGSHITTDGDMFISDSTLVNLDEPSNYKEIMAGHEFAKWKEEMDNKIKSMTENQVWNLVDNVPGHNIVGCKWIFKKKTDMDGKVHTFKDRLVAKGFTQTLGVDYDETFSPRGLWMLSTPNRLCTIEKSIYGLKQDSRRWNICFDDKVKEFYFSRSEDESCVYVKASRNIVTFMVLYVDDMLLIGNNVPTLQEVKSWLRKCFATKDLRETAYILGIRILRNRSKRLLGLSQSTYLDKVLKHFSMENSKKREFPIQSNTKLSKTHSPSTYVEIAEISQVLYASAYGSIMYAMTCTRPDVAFALSMVSRYQGNPGRAHWIAVNNFLKYLRRTNDWVLMLGGNDDLRVIGYSDANFQTDGDNFHSLSGWVFTLIGGANFIRDLGVVLAIKEPMEIFYDNEGAVALTKEIRYHGRSRDINRKYHFIRH